MIKPNIVIIDGRWCVGASARRISDLDVMVKLPWNEAAAFVRKLNEKRAMQYFTEHR